MRVVITALTLPFLLSVPGLAQEPAVGTLTGRVEYGDQVPVTKAPIQLKEKVSGTVARVLSGAGGVYTFERLPAGLYEMSIAMPCCAFRQFTAEVMIQAGNTTRFNPRLVETLNGQTLGDDPGRNAEAIRRRQVVSSEPVPRLGDGRPDLSGVWLVSRDLYPEPPDALPWAQAVAKQRVERNFVDHPHTRCLPGNLPVPGGASPFIGKFVHTPSLLVILFEDVPGFRQIFLDGRRHPSDPNPSWMGHSVGRWDGDTLVVDTVGFNDSVVIGDYPHTERLHMTERYRRVDFGHLEVQVTYEDPGAFRAPWIMNLVWDLAPQEEIIEFVCENNKTEHLVGN